MDGVSIVTLFVLAGGSLIAPALTVADSTPVVTPRASKSNAPRPAYSTDYQFSHTLSFTLFWRSTRAALRGAPPDCVLAGRNEVEDVNRVFAATRAFTEYTSPVNVENRAAPRRWMDSTKTITAAFRTLRVPVMSSTSAIIDAHKALRRTAERAGDSVRVAILDEALNAALTFHAGFVPEVSQ